MPLKRVETGCGEQHAAADAMRRKAVRSPGPGAPFPDDCKHAPTELKNDLSARIRFAEKRQGFGFGPGFPMLAKKREINEGEKRRMTVS